MQISGLNIGIVADDMTGANDTALQFFLAGAGTRIILDLQDPPDPPEDAAGTPRQAWALTTNSRHEDPNAAEATVRRAVATLRDRFGVDYFYKKVDSTLRGNIAHECLGFLDELEGDCVVVVPAYPLQKRQTVGGYQLVNSVPVERTSIARDPQSPVRSSHIPTLLEQATNAEIVGYIGLSTVLHGAGPILKELTDRIQQGKKLVVIDATSEEDLDQIALCIEKIQKTARVLPCGSAGLAQALTRRWLQQEDEKVERKHPDTRPSPVLIVNGSTSDTTREQALQLIENYAYYAQNSKLEVFEIPPAQLLGLEPVDDLIRAVVAAFGDQNTVMLSTALKQESYGKTLQLAADNGITESRMPELIHERLAAVTQAALSGKPVKLVLTGGETAAYVCRQLDVEVLEVIDQADPSVPVTIDAKGRWIVTKSGSFGAPESLANIVRFLREREASSVHV